MKINDSLNLMKALGDASRLLIVNALMEKPQYLEELSKRLSLAPSTVSFHLKKLESAGLILKKKEQYYVVFYINEEIFGTVLKDIISLDNIDRVVQDERLKEYRSAVVETYYEGKKLLKIPSQTKKRNIILNEILKQFKKDKVYSEKEVDEIIKQVFPDYCSIRRYFIDYRMMQRKSGRYNIHPDYIIQDELPAVKSNKTKIKNSRLIKEHKEFNIIKKINMETEKRKEIIKNYKQVPVPMGIYQLRNLKNGKILIGSTKNLKARKNREWMALEMKNHPVKELQDAWDELGEKGVVYEIIDTLEPKKDDPGYNYTKDLEVLEDLWLEKLQPYNDRGYNEMKKKKDH